MQKERSHTIILASASPRRKELMEQMGLSFTVHKTDAEETYPEGLSPAEAVTVLATQKVIAALHELGKASTHKIVIGADTLVEADGVPLGKPKDEKDALTMLKSLSGRSHAVHTGLALYLDGRLIARAMKTEVIMRPYTEEEALSYIKTGEPFGKAGAYAIQGLGGKLVACCNGDKSNVIGLPCGMLSTMLDELEGYNEKEASPCHNTKKKDEVCQ